MDKATLAAPLLALVLAGVAGPACAGSSWVDGWSRSDNVGRNPVARSTHEEYKLGPTGEVEVRNIGGSVEVTAVDGPTAGFTYERRAATQEDFDCETLHSEQDKERLRIWVDSSREPGCHSIRATDKLTLTVPRGSAVKLSDIGDSVRVTGVEGLLRLSSIGDKAVLDGVQQLDASSIGDSLTITVTKLGKAGINVDSVGDSVELTLPKSLDARMRITSVGGEIRGPELRITSSDDFETTFGKGGPMIRIDSVGDSVVTRDGPALRNERKKRRRDED